MRLNLMRLASIIGGCLLLTACATQPAPGGSGAPKSSATLPAHPRLIATPADWQRLAARRAAEPELQRFVERLLTQARKDLALKPLTHQLQGKRLLSVSREFIRRALLWAFAYRISGGQEFFERARAEMLAIADFPDWNPKHYLDVAEMSAGLALSYDWLFNELNHQDRATIRQALIDQGITQARYGHKTFSMTNNWGQVCIGGMVLGALAVEEDEPELARDLLAAARPHIFTALEAYKPDGVYPEGPGYWSYGTTYSTLLIAALRSSLNTDWNLLAAPGLLRSAEFFAQATGPSGKNFNFADGGEGQDLSPALFYLARELGQPALLQDKLAMIRANKGMKERYAPLLALWWPPTATTQPAPLHFTGQGPQPVAIWRSSWTDPHALYFAIKAGGAHHNHAHMDAGSFVLDLDGVRWARDLGMQDYNSLESRGIDLWNMRQNSPRWQVFRLGSDAHNTLTLDGKPHSATGMAALKSADASSALIDLGPVLGLAATRQVQLAGSTVQLQNQISGALPGSRIRWAMNTEAEVRIEGNTALLTQKGKTLRVRFAGNPVTLEVLDISPPRAAYDTPNKNTRQLIAHGLSSAEGQWGLNVHFSRD